MRAHHFLFATLATVTALASPLRAETFLEAHPDLICQIDASYQASAGAIELRTGTLGFAEGVVELALPDSIYALSSTDTQYGLHDLWGNPADPSVQAMIFQTGH
jgi:hypothetical protein